MQYHKHKCSQFSTTFPILFPYQYVLGILYTILLAVKCCKWEQAAKTKPFHYPAHMTLLFTTVCFLVYLTFSQFRRLYSIKWDVDSVWWNWKYDKGCSCCLFKESIPAYAWRDCEKLLLHFFISFLVSPLLLILVNCIENSINKTEHKHSSLKWN